MYVQPTEQSGNGQLGKTFLSWEIYSCYKTSNTFSLRTLTWPCVVVQLKPGFWVSKPQSSPSRWRSRAAWGDGEWASCWETISRNQQKESRRDKDTNTRAVSTRIKPSLVLTAEDIDTHVVCVFTELWMLLRFSKWKSHGSAPPNGAKVRMGGTPCFLGNTGSASTSWFRKAEVMWPSSDGKLTSLLSTIWKIQTWVSKHVQVGALTY